MFDFVQICPPILSLRTKPAARLEKNVHIFFPPLRVREEDATKNIRMIIREYGGKDAIKN